MKIKQFEYEPLAHYSYALISDQKMVIIDPQRDPLPYYQYAEEHDSKILAVLLTHPHADFVSSHLQIHEETGATIYNSAQLGADYPHQAFDEGDHFELGKTRIRAINTPGHSPDSITIVAEKDGEVVLFTGDTLFIGDVGRPDLREKAGNTTAKRKELASMMYHTIQNKFTDLPDEAIVYPTHGAGSLCGKSMSDANSSTLGEERQHNWAFKKQTEEEFVQEILDNQPFIPSYFGYDVDVNKSGAPNVRAALGKIPFKLASSVEGLVVDVRDKAAFKKAHLPDSINIQASSINDKFETWLGAIIQPNEKFSIVIASPKDLENILERVSKIGYEKQLENVLTLGAEKVEKSPSLDIKDFKENPSHYTIVDIRNSSETEEDKFFENALLHPLNELRESYTNIPTDKPIVVHCAGGYRSAAGSSILEKKLKGATVYDLGEEVNAFK